MASCDVHEEPLQIGEMISRCAHNNESLQRGTRCDLTPGHGGQSVSSRIYRNDLDVRGCRERERSARRTDSDQRGECTRVRCTNLASMRLEGRSTAAEAVAAKRTDEVKRPMNLKTHPTHHNILVAFHLQERQQQEEDWHRASSFTCPYPDNCAEERSGRDTKGGQFWSVLVIFRDHQIGGASCENIRNPHSNHLACVYHSGFRKAQRERTFHSTDAQRM